MCQTRILPVYTLRICAWNGTRNGKNPDLIFYNSFLNVFIHYPKQCGKAELGEQLFQLSASVVSTLGLISRSPVIVIIVILFGPYPHTDCQGNIASPTLSLLDGFLWSQVAPAQGIRPALNPGRPRGKRAR